MTPLAWIFPSVLPVPRLVRLFTCRASRQSPTLLLQTYLPPPSPAHMYIASLFSLPLSPMSLGWYLTTSNDYLSIL
ncbi:hypothetical protein FKP32DRAFT_225956 [Trametes sanguinea]|nr:hypothetical protein FKP32DRAFT_225956 [Trametes sanguinea]